MEKKVEKKEQYELIMEAKRIQGEKDGRKYDFLTFEGYEKSGKKCRFIFTRECGEPIKEVGQYKVVVDKKDINKDKQNRFSRYYIKNYISCEPFNNSFDNDDDLDF